MRGKFGINQPRSFFEILEISRAKRERFQKYQKRNEVNLFEISRTKYSIPG